MYSYCQNDPVNMVDPSGNAGFLGMLIITTILGAGIGAGIEVGKQFLTNDFSLNDFDWGSFLNSAIVGGALGLSLTMGVIFFGPAIAGVTAGTAATTTGLSVSGAFAISSAISFGAGAIGYSVEEWMNGRTPEFWKAMMHGGFVMIEGMVNFGVGGLIGSVGKIGTAGKPMLISAEWWGKWIFSKEFTKPLTITIDLLRNNL